MLECHDHNFPDGIITKYKTITQLNSRLVSLVARNHEIASSIPAGSSNKFESKNIISCWLDMTTESGAAKKIITQS
jgi:hypothetical protein